jgi:hypothetical protein
MYKEFRKGRKLIHETQQMGETDEQFQHEKHRLSGRSQK